MKEKLVLSLVALPLAVPVLADTTGGELPEPSTLALFFSAAVAVVLARQLKR